ncbi:hypothetical protein GC174_15235 [bacterium]|nr:hypothetical protein [bacterium]
MKTSSLARYDYLPGFTSDGRLPVGEYNLPWPLFSLKFGTNSERRVLLRYLLKLLKQLKAAGIDKAIIGGSFISAKVNPTDIDLGILKGKATRADLKKIPLTFKKADGSIYKPVDVVLGQSTKPFFGLSVLHHYKSAVNFKPCGVIIIDLDSLP